MTNTIMMLIMKMMMLITVMIILTFDVDNNSDYDIIDDESGLVSFVERISYSNIN